MRLRAHDLRGTFVTLALASGRTEAWVSDRTGHKSSVMINRYRRAARAAGELGLGWLAPLDQALPESRSETVDPAGVSHGVSQVAGSEALGKLGQTLPTAEFLPVGLVGHSGLEPEANGLRVRPWPDNGPVSDRFDSNRGLFGSFTKAVGGATD